MDRVRLIQQRLMTAESRQKSYADRRARDVSFVIGELKVSPTKGVMRFGKKRKLSPRFIGPFGILEKYGDVAYRLALPPNLSAVHPVLHVLMLKRYRHDNFPVI